jgi:hypothetical protein
LEKGNLTVFFFLLCSEEEAKKKIYNVSCERYFGFGCEIDEETSNKLEGSFNLCSMMPLLRCSLC